jgi:type I restriction enzyme R subunit
MLAEAIRKYQTRSIEAAQVITQLIEVAKQMQEAHHRGENLGLSDDELAFYDALEVNDSAVKVLGDESLRIIARELVETVRRNVTIDWAVRDTARAKLRTMVKRILRKYGILPTNRRRRRRPSLSRRNYWKWRHDTEPTLDA